MVSRLALLSHPITVAIPHKAIPHFERAQTSGAPGSCLTESNAVTAGPCWIQMQLPGHACLALPPISILPLNIQKKLHTVFILAWKINNNNTKVIFENLISFSQSNRISDFNSKKTHDIKIHGAHTGVLCDGINMAGVIIERTEQDAFRSQQPHCHCPNSKCSGPDASENRGAQQMLSVFY